MSTTPFPPLASPRATGTAAARRACVWAHVLNHHRALDGAGRRRKPGGCATSPRPPPKRAALQRRSYCMHDAVIMHQGHMRRCLAARSGCATVVSEAGLVRMSSSLRRALRPAVVREPCMAEAMQSCGGLITRAQRGPGWGGQAGRQIRRPIACCRCEGCESRRLEISRRIGAARGGRCRGSS